MKTTHASTTVNMKHNRPLSLCVFVFHISDASKPKGKREKTCLVKERIIAARFFILLLAKLFRQITRYPRLKTYRF